MAIVFTGGRLDRAAERRTDPEWVAEQAASPHARAVLAGDAGIHVTDEPRLALLPLAALDAAEPLLLGLDETGPGVRRRRQRSASRRRPGLGRDQRWIAAHGEGSPDPATGTRAIGLRCRRRHASPTPTAASPRTPPRSSTGTAATATARSAARRPRREGGIVRRCRAAAATTIRAPTRS